MDLLQLVNDTIDNTIDSLAMVKLMKNELVRIAAENASLKQQLVKQSQVIQKYQQSKETPNEQQ